MEPNQLAEGASWFGTNLLFRKVNLLWSVFLFWVDRCRFIGSVAMPCAGGLRQLRFVGCNYSKFAELYSLDYKSVQCVCVQAKLSTPLVGRAFIYSFLSSGSLSLCCVWCTVFMSIGHFWCSQWVRSGLGNLDFHALLPGLLIWVVLIPVGRASGVF